MYTNYTDFKKQANMLDTFNNVIQTGGSIGAMVASYIVAAGVLGGMGTGWVGAKLTAHSKRDEDTVQKSYENRRLANDIGYQKTMLQQEWNNTQRMQTPTQAGSIRLR